MTIVAAASARRGMKPRVCVGEARAHVASSRFAPAALVCGSRPELGPELLSSDFTPMRGVLASRTYKLANATLDDRPHDVDDHVDEEVRQDRRLEAKRDIEPAEGEP